MNPLQSFQNFGNNVVQGAKMLNPQSVTRGLTQLGGDMWNTVVGKNKTKVASKMASPAKPQTAPLKPQTNPGFAGYQNYLNQAKNY